MPKARVIVPINNPKTGEPIAAGAEVDLDDEAYQLLRQQGAVEASAEDQKASQTPEGQGNYGARTGREEAGGTDAPKAKEPDEPKKK